MSKKYVVFARPDSANEIQQIDDFADKTASEILATLKLHDELLAITTPFYREILPPDSKPFEKYPQIMLEDRPDKYKRPDFYLSILADTWEDKCQIRVAVSVADNDVPPFWVPITTSIIENGKASELFPLIIQAFAFESNNHKFELADQPLEPDTPIVEIIQKTRDQMIKMSCELTEKALKSIRRRINIVGEVMSTEKTYIDGLDNLSSYWRPETVKAKLFTEEEWTAMFHDIPVIKSCHQRFYLDLQARGNSYSAILSDVFLEFSQFFKVSLLYISAYSTNIGIVTQKGTQKSWATKMKDLAAKNPNGSTNSFNAYMITPVQRMPRYILLIRDLMAVTPTSHPDSILLHAAMSKIEQITHQINDATTRAEHMADLAAVQASLTKPFPIVDPTRLLVYKEKVSILKPANGQGCLYLFNDMVTLHSIEKKGETVIYDSPVGAFRYWISSLNGITFNGPAKKRRVDIFQVTFEKAESRQKWIKNLNEQWNKMEKRERSLQFRWTDCEFTQVLPSVAGHAAAYLNGVYYVFGGDDNNDILLLKPEMGTVNKLPSEIGRRIGHTVTVGDHNKIFLFGGHDSSNEYFNDLWVYDPLTGNWTRLSNEFAPEPRSNHSSCWYKDTLYIFGGCFKNKVYFNDVGIYSASEDRWVTVPFFENVPSKRAFHSATVFNGKMLIYGGRDKAVTFKDTAFLDLTDIKWEKIDLVGDPLISRMNHQMITVGQFILILGGVTDGKIACPYIIDTTAMEVKKMTSYGNEPTSLSAFSISYIPETKTFLVYGGIDIVTNTNVSALSSVSLPDYVQLRLPSEKVTSDDEDALKSLGPSKAKKHKKRHRKDSTKDSPGENYTVSRNPNTLRIQTSTSTLNSLATSTFPKRQIPLESSASNEELQLVAHETPVIPIKPGTPMVTGQPHRPIPAAPKKVIMPPSSSDDQIKELLKVPPPEIPSLIQEPAQVGTVEQQKPAPVPEPEAKTPVVPEEPAAPLPEPPKEEKVPQVPEPEVVPEEPKPEIPAVPEEMSKEPEVPGIPEEPAPAMPEGTPKEPKETPKEPEPESEIPVVPEETPKEPEVVPEEPPKAVEEPEVPVIPVNVPVVPEEAPKEQEPEPKVPTVPEDDVEAKKRQKGEQERLEAERKQQEAIEAEKKTAEEKARLEAEAKAKEEEAARKQAEAEKKAKEEAERKERLAKEASARKAKEEAERQEAARRAAEEQKSTASDSEEEDKEDIQAILQGDYDEPRFCKHLQIDTSKMLQFQVRALSRKLKVLWDKFKQNNELSQQIAEASTSIPSIETLTEPIEFFLKLRNEGQIQIVRAFCMPNIDSITSLIEKALGRAPQEMKVKLVRGEAILDQSNLPQLLDPILMKKTSKLEIFIK